LTARLALVGAPGSGKSVVAAELAKRWDATLLDTDEVYAEQHGRTVADAVIDDEAAFRSVEERIVLTSLRAPGALVAVGSGALSEAVLAALAQVPVVWLEVGLVDAARRTGLSGIRPASLGNVRGQLHDMLNARAQIYASPADLRILTDGRLAEDVADEIEQWEARR
jgi:shikimate kinase